MHTFQSKLCFSAIANEVFYLINFQTLCVTDDGHYLPAEIGVIEYSVKRGISKKLHRFIEAGLYIHVFSFVWIAYIKLTFISLIPWIHLFRDLFKMCINILFGRYLSTNKGYLLCLIRCVIVKSKNTMHFSI